MSDREVAAPRRGPRVLAVLGIVLAIAVVAFLLVGTTWSGASLAPDANALARLKLSPLAGSLSSAEAFGPGGRRIPLAVAGGRLTPLEPLEPGERVTVDIVVRRPSWLGWALGATRTEQLTVRAPTAQVAGRWLTVAPGAALAVRFDRPVAGVQYRIAGQLTRLVLPHAQSVVAIAHPSAVGTVEVAATVRPWERPSAPVTVSWFPASALPVAVVDPAPGTTLAPAAPIRLTFSRPMVALFGSARPQFSGDVPGSWRETDSHTLVFTPTGLGVALGSSERLVLPRAVAVTGTTGTPMQTTTAIAWAVPLGSTLRLQQLLAQAGYLPLSWTPAGAPVARTASAQTAAAVSAPAGTFTWRYPNIPAELRALWSPGQPNQITRGAVMTFEHEHGLTVDAIAGPAVWQALLSAAIAGTRHTAPYSYVYVHRNVPQKLTLWSAGRTLLTSPGNTGVPAAPTQLGTFPVFEHIPVGTMSGTNPGGGSYNDPGIRWISYFNGGDALHAFNRASFGTPQSLGCVELPLATAARVWPYTPIGTLVTIEN